MKEIRRMKLDELKRIESIAYHESLPDHLIERIDKLFSTFSEVLPSYKEWVDGFRMDMHPEEEILIWEVMAEVYNKLLREQSPRSKTEREELFKKVLRGSLEAHPIELTTVSIPLA